MNYGLAYKILWEEQKEWNYWETGYYVECRICKEWIYENDFYNHDHFDILAYNNLYL